MAFTLRTLRLYGLTLMKIILVMVQSLNGKITAGVGSRIHDWSSKEDQKYFTALTAKARLIIMGRKTYEAAKEHMVLSPNTLRVVLTKNPKRYKRETVAGQLEFAGNSPKVLIQTLKRRGYRKALLVGGAEINSAFLKAKLVNELWLTLEPLILGAGKNLVTEEHFKKQLELKSVKKLNEKGTLLLKYIL